MSAALAVLLVLLAAVLGPGAAAAVSTTTASSCSSSCSSAGSSSGSWSEDSAAAANGAQVTGAQVADDQPDAVTSGDTAVQTAACAVAEGRSWSAGPALAGPPATVPD